MNNETRRKYGINKMNEMMEEIDMIRNFYVGDKIFEDIRNELVNIRAGLETIKIKLERLGEL